MPNVLFVADSPFRVDNKSYKDGFYYTDEEGAEILKSLSIEYTLALASGFKEVPIYEAIPELVPDGMVYDKESDSLIKPRITVLDRGDGFIDMLEDELKKRPCPISDRAKHIAKHLPFNCSQVQYG